MLHYNYRKAHSVMHAVYALLSLLLPINGELSRAI